MELHDDRPDAQPDRERARVGLPASVVEAGLTDLLSVHDGEGRYLYVSPSWERTLGLSTTQVEAESPFGLSLIHPDDAEEALEALGAAVTNREPARLRYRLRRSDSTYVWVESHGRATDVDGEVRVVVLTRDVAHVESLVQGLSYERRLKSQLAELVEQQRRFLTTVSHRARTPLTVVVGMIEVLRRNGHAMDEEQRDVLFERAAEHGQQLVELLTTVTDADKLVRSDIVLQRRLVDLHALAQGVLDERAGAGARFHNRIGPGESAVVDPLRIRRVLRVLIGNAVNHAGVGATVEVRLVRRDDGVELLVEDDGPGVPAAAHQRVFDAFSHADSDVANPGAGLGLYIVAELAALHGGRAWVDDRPGGGARFHVWLPRPRADHTLSGLVEEDSQQWASAAAALNPLAKESIRRLLLSLQKRAGLDTVYLSILDGKHQHVLATSSPLAVAGISAGTRVPLEDTYCGRMVTGDIDRLIPDTATHPGVARLPATRDGLACYVGVPVHLPSGQVFGSLCGAATTARHDLEPSVVSEFAVFAEVLGQQLADEGFIDGTVLDASGRVADVLTRAESIRTVFQPVVSLGTGGVDTVEAYARFEGHERPVGLWFADAARAGLLVDLEVKVAAIALARFSDQFAPHVSLCINVSPATVLSGRFARLLADAPVGRLVLDLSEHAVVVDYRPLREALRPLRDGGLRLAVDDVGTGSSGLGHLLQLEPDIVKVDSSIVTTLMTTPSNRATVTGLAHMAAHMGAEFVADGLEDPALVDTVRSLGFTHAQGNGLGEPEPAPDLDRVERTARRLLADPAEP